jgi:YQGE family putative transporter
MTKQSMLLLGLDFGFTFASALSGLFLSIYLWKIVDSWVINGVYNGMLFLFVFVGFWAGGWLAKKTNHLVPFRMGIAMMVVFFLVLINIQTLVAEYPGWFGMFHGLAIGFYWIAMLVLAYEMTTEETRLQYIGVQASVLSIAGLLAPFLSGHIIEWLPGFQGYLVIFIFSFLAYTLIMIGSFFLKTLPQSSKTFYFSFVLRKKLKHSLWQKHYAGWFLMGLREGIVLFVPPILLYHIFQSEGTIGSLTVIGGLITILSSQLFARYGRKHHFPSYNLLAAVGMLVTTIPLLYGLNQYTVLLFLFGNAFFNPLQRSSYTSHLYQLVSEKNSSNKLRTELIITRQLFLTGGRLLTLILFAAVIVGMDTEVIAISLILATLTQILIYFMMLVPRTSK